MNVTGVTDSQAASTTTSTATSATMSADYNTFLQLLIAEMRNQDPTNPMDTAQYMSQFAQLSTVEQSIQTNTKLDALLSSSALSQAEGLIGRTASFTTSDGQTVSETITSVSINNGGSIATLSDGSKVALGPGLTIS
jgi:flagellar basal-body rod modification protein FlgD